MESRSSRRLGERPDATATGPPECCCAGAEASVIVGKFRFLLAYLLDRGDASAGRLTTGPDENFSTTKKPRDCHVRTEKESAVSTVPRQHRGARLQRRGGLPDRCPE